MIKKQSHLLTKVSQLRNKKNHQKEKKMAIENNEYVIKTSADW